MIETMSQFGTHFLYLVEHLYHFVCLPAVPTFSLGEGGSR